MAESIEERVVALIKARDELTLEVTKKRTELAALSRQTVENLETSIPALRVQHDQLKAQIASLEKAITLKQAEANKEKANYQAQYDALKASLVAEHEQLRLILNSVEADQANKAAVLVNRGKTLDQKEIALQNKEEALRVAQAKFEAEKKSKLEEWAEREANISLDEAELLHNISEHEDDAKELEAMEEEYANRSVVLESRLKAAQDTINRISEAQVILDQAKSIQAHNDTRKKELNELQVKIQADAKKNARRDEELNAREEKLNARQANIEANEANIVGG